MLTPVLLGLVLGCSKSDPDTPQLTEDLHLKAIYVDGKPYRKFNYDTDKRVESIEEYEDGQLTGSELYEYNENGQLKTRWRLDTNGEFDVAYTYEYSGGKLIKSLVYPELLEDPTYGSTYEYTSDGKLSMVYFFSASAPEKIQTYTKYDYDTDGNLTTQRNYNIVADKPDVLYYEEHRTYSNPQRTAAIREKIGDRLTDDMFLYSSSQVTNYNNDGSGDINYAYAVEVGIEYDPQGWPVESDVTANHTHPQYNELSSVITYEYVKL